MNDRNSPSPPLLRLRDVAAGHGRRAVLTGVTFDVRPAERLVFVGPNGQGKTTLAHTILGVLPALEGRLEVAADLHDRIGFVPQGLTVPSTVPTTVREFVSLGLVGTRGAGRQRMQRVAQALAQVDISFLDSRSLRELSMGQRQRAALARALVRRPLLLVLDEPLASLDLASQHAFLALLERLNRDQGLTILLITHDLAFAARWGDRVALFAGGRVEVGGPGDLLTPHRIAAAFEVEPETAWTWGPPGWAPPADKETHT